MGNSLFVTCVGESFSIHDEIKVAEDTASHSKRLQALQALQALSAPQVAAPPGTILEGADGCGSVHLLLERLVCGSHGQWEDTVFPSGPSSLCHDWKAHSRAAQWKQLTWANASSFMSDLFVFSPLGVSPCDIQQGILGDCYFLAALSALADTHQDLVEKLVVSSPAALRAGVSVVRLNWNGHWVCIPVSHTFPCLPNAENGTRWCPAFSSARQSRGLWVALTEKALAKLYGTYQAIEGGALSCALRDLTGAPTRMHSLDFGATGVQEWLTKVADMAAGFFNDLFCARQSVAIKDHAGRQKQLDSASSVWQAMVEASKLKFAMCASCGEKGNAERLDDDTGLVFGHGYTVLDVWDASFGRECLVRLRNPWGRGRWKGAYSDRDPRLTIPTLRSHSLDSESVEEDEGIFWMSYTDFCTHFSAVDICRVRQGYVSSSMHLVMPSTTDRSLIHKAVVLKVASGSAPTMLQSLIGMPDRESSLSVLQHTFQGGAYSESGSDYAAVGLELFELQKGHAAHLAVSQFSSCREVSLHIPLMPNKTYAAVLHWHSRKRELSATSANAELAEDSVTLRAYAPGIVSLNSFHGDLGKLRCVAYAAAVRGSESEQCWSEDGAQLRCWSDPEYHTRVFLFDAGKSRSGMLVSMHWKMTGMLFQDQFPLEASQHNLDAARGGQPFEREQLLQLKCGEERLIVLTMFDPSAGCSLAYSYTAAAVGCLECGDPVGVAVPGRFSGSYVNIDQSQAGGPGKIHSECSNAFSMRHADPCLHCGQPILQGSYFSFEKDDLGMHPSGKVHAECDTGWRRCWAQQCAQCGGPIMRLEGTYSGSYCSYQENDLGKNSSGKVHAECDVQWRRCWARPCAHCRGPIMQLEGKYSGSAVSYQGVGIPGGQVQVHQECNEAYSSQRTELNS